MRIRLADDGGACQPLRRSPPRYSDADIFARCRRLRLMLAPFRADIFPMPPLPPLRHADAAVRRQRHAAI